MQQIKDRENRPVSIPDYAVLEEAAAAMDRCSQPAACILAIQKLLGRGGSFDMQTPPHTALSFPSDHHLHPSMGAEWYYLVCNVTALSPAGERRDIGLMWWMQKNRVVGSAAQREAGWTDEQCTVLASKVTAITRDDAKRIVRRSENLQWPLHGGELRWSQPGEDFAIACGPDRLSGSADVLPLRAQVDDGEHLSFDLRLESREGLAVSDAFILRGNNGTGITGLPTPGFDYCWPQLRVAGTVTLEGATYTIQTGTAWLDHQMMMGSLQNAPGTPPGMMIPYVDDPSPFIGWCWFCVNLASGDAFSASALNYGGLALQLPVIPGSAAYFHLEDGRWSYTSLDSPNASVQLTKMQSLPVVVARPGPETAAALVPNGWAIQNLTGETTPVAAGGALVAWASDGTFNAEDGSLVSEMPVDFIPAGADSVAGSGFCEAIGFENVLSYRDRAVAFLKEQARG